MSEPVVVPDMRTNVLRQRKYAAATRADAGPGNLAPQGGNPLSSILSVLQTAWVSPSQERTHFAETLDGTGSAVPGAFRSHAALCRSEAGAEPAEVDCNDPSDGWKADASRIDARITGMLQNPYLRGGF